MQCNANVGKTDQMLRIIAGLAILAYGAYAQEWLGLIGLVPLLTGIFRFCPAYCPLKINTGA